MRHFCVALAITICSVSFCSKVAFAQSNVTEEYCRKEQKRSAKLRQSIIKQYTRGDRAISQAAAERMATNIEIVIARQCSLAIARRISATRYVKENERLLLIVASNSVRDERFDLTDSTTLAHFFK